MKNFAKTKLHSSTRLSLMVLAGVALTVTLCADRVAVARGNQLPLTSLQGAAGSKPNGVALPAPSEPTGPWTLGTPYPITIVRYGFAQTATHFYVFGGVSNGTRVNNVNRMDIAAGTWQSRAPMPFTSEAPTCALMASTGIVYCTEGDTGNHFASYNIATDSWTALALIPGTDHYGSASGAFNGKVFVAGGTTSISNLVQVYDVATNTWSAGTAAPSTFLLAGYQQVGQYLYIVGGFSSSGPNNGAGALSSVLNKGLPKQPAVPLANNTTTWRLDMSSAPGLWNVGPAFTQGRADFGLAYDAGTNTLYAMGGDATGGGFFDSTNLVDELSVASWPGGTWMASPPNLILPNRQANQAGFYGAGQIWSVGGIVGQTLQFLSEVQRRTNGGGGGGCTPGTWVTKANYPLSVYGAANATDGTYAYVFGGNTIGGAQHAEANRYDPVANSWSPLASMTAGADYLLHGEYGGNGKIYVMGGLNNGTLNRIYDIGTNMWSSGAAVPVAVYDHGHAYANGKIYVIGGFVGGVASSTVYAYDVASNTWSSPLAPLPQAEFNMACGVINNKIYVAGGSTGSDFITNLYIYDIAGNSWSSGAPMGTGANYPAGTVVGGKLWVIGGGNPFGASAPASFNNTQIYDPATNTWSNGPVLNQARSFADAVTLNGAGTQSALIVGGYNSTSGTSLNSVEMNTSNCGAGGCGLLVGSGLTTGYAPNNYTLIASNTVNYTFANSQAAPNDYALFQTHDPWGATVVKNAITGAGHTYTVFTPAQLAGFNFSQYRVVILNWDDTFTSDFLAAYTAAIPALEAYVNAGGVVWVQAAIQGSPGDNYPMPFGGQGNGADFSPSDFILDPSSPMMTGVPNPITGNSASHVSYSGLPAGRHVVVTKTDANGPPVVYDLRPGGSCAPMASDAFSRKVHGGAGTFDIPLPLTGPVGVECRLGPTYQMIIDFATSVTVQSASVTSGTGMVSSFSGSGTSQITVNLSGVTDVQRITMTLHNVNNGTVTGDVPISMGVLVGDVNGSTGVNSTDVALTKSQVGHTVVSSNFREDVNFSGTITATDVTIVKSDVGHALPP